MSATREHELHPSCPRAPRSRQPCLGGKGGCPPGQHSPPPSQKAALTRARLKAGSAGTQARLGHGPAGTLALSHQVIEDILTTQEDDEKSKKKKPEPKKKDQKVKKKEPKSKIKVRESGFQKSTGGFCSFALGQGGHLGARGGQSPESGDHAAPWLPSSASVGRQPAATPCDL